MPESDSGDSEVTGDDVIRRAQAKAMGRNPETMELEDIGFYIEVEE